MHQSLPNHVVGYSEDRNCRIRLLRGSSCNIPAAQNDIHTGLDQFRRMFRELLHAQTITAQINLKVLALDEAEPSQLVKERDVMLRIAWAQMQAPEAIGPPWLLRVRVEWPRRRRAADKGDELTPPHVLPSIRG